MKSDLTLGRPDFGLLLMSSSVPAMGCLREPEIEVEAKNLYFVNNSAPTVNLIGSSGSKRLVSM